MQPIGHAPAISSSDSWLALSIGNSRLHWAQFTGNDLQHTWNTPHFSATDAQQCLASLTPNAPLYIASVVPQQSQLWQAYPSAHVITLEQVLLQGLYPTLGIDRALAVWGAIDTVGSPVLLIDAGTALTLTGAAGDRLVGGAILPGLRLQFQSLNQATAALPDMGTANLTVQHPLPPRWAANTADAIASGILYTLLAGLQAFVDDWWQQFPDSPVMLRGGDSDRLHSYLTAYAPALARQITIEPNLIFWGMRKVRGERLKDEG
ncbi:pantothenate kinase [Stenomitos frigidus]|uniref:Type III pantothenate kinase n=1 Tax=Stenomitos frigidus ULC18 TaxID=2107698 RepID=A0A2T1DTE7_9CYAN|nr:pantothenate kinase [Stenomitos frigidus]PSB23773.1 pantothenate kinase [Stenomitos frigidus ULC18]